MTLRKTATLRKLIYDTLNNDLTLRTLLGGTADRVRHGNPKSKSEYPLVCYNIITDMDEPYKPDRASGIADTTLMIQVFSAESNVESADLIEDRIYELLHGSNLLNANMIIYSCYRISRTPIYDPAIEVWVISSKYSIVNAIKT